MVDTVGTVGEPESPEPAAPAVSGDGSPSKWKGLKSRLKVNVAVVGAKVSGGRSGQKSPTYQTSPTKNKLGTMVKVPTLNKK